MSGPFLEQKRLVNNLSPIIFDCGANVGQTTSRYLSMFPKASVHAFEPNPAVFSKLAGAYRNNPSVVLNRKAVGPRNGSSELFVGNHPGTSSLLPKNEKLSPSWTFTSSVPITVVSIDDYCSARSIKSIDILKMDIQGYELFALRGASSLLRRSDIGLIFLEMLYEPLYKGAPLANEVHRFLTSMRYRLHRRFDACETFGDWLYMRSR